MQRHNHASRHLPEEARISRTFLEASFRHPSCSALAILRARGAWAAQRLPKLEELPSCRSGSFQTRSLTDQHRRYAESSRHPWTSSKCFSGEHGLKAAKEGAAWGAGPKHPSIRSRSKCRCSTSARDPEGVHRPIPHPLNCGAQYSVCVCVCVCDTYVRFALSGQAILRGALHA